MLPLLLPGLLTCSLFADILQHMVQLTPRITPSIFPRKYSPNLAAAVLLFNSLCPMTIRTFCGTTVAVGCCTPLFYDLTSLTYSSQPSIRDSMEGARQRPNEVPVINYKWNSKWVENLFIPWLLSWVEPTCDLGCDLGWIHPTSWEQCEMWVLESEGVWGLAQGCWQSPWNDRQIAVKTVIGDMHIHREMQEFTKSQDKVFFFLKNVSATHPLLIHNYSKEQNKGYSSSPIPLLWGSGQPSYHSVTKMKYINMQYPQNFPPASFHRPWDS